MKFSELCRVAKYARITVFLRNGNQVASLPNTEKKEFDWTGVKWLTQKRYRALLDCYVTNVEPTAHNYMNVTVVPNKLAKDN